MREVGLVNTRKEAKNVFVKLELSEELLGVSDGRDWFARGPWLDVSSPIDGECIARVRQANRDDYEYVIRAAKNAFEFWSKGISALDRGNIVHQFGLELAKHQADLAKLITLEMGKPYGNGKNGESSAEVQEGIDAAIMDAGLARIMHGKIINSQRTRHELSLRWRPLGLVGIISPWNFPFAIWAWNLLPALICGDACIWKPASKTPLTAIACQKILARVLTDNNMPPGISSLVVGGGSSVGEWLINDPAISLISYTGSCEVGKHVGVTVAGHFGKSLLEGGGNNPVVVTAESNLELAAKSVFWSGIGTAAQRCTTIRRVIVQRAVYTEFKELLLKHYETLKGRIGNPLNERTLMGPLVSPQSVELLIETAKIAEEEGGKVLLVPCRLLYPGNCYASPGIIEVEGNVGIVQEENFVPLLFIMPYDDLEEAIVLANETRYGLAASIFTDNIQEARQFQRDTIAGMVHVNCPPGGNETHVWFGGEKETGGGRERDWQKYARPCVTAENWSGEMKLAQDLEF